MMQTCSSQDVSMAIKNMFHLEGKSIIFLPQDTSVAPLDLDNIQIKCYQAHFRLASRLPTSE